MQVPYNPVSSEKPSTGGTPSYNVSVSSNAFGAQEAQAKVAAAQGIGQAQVEAIRAVGHAEVALWGSVGSLGEEVNKVGNEMWQRAVSLQQLRNDTEAREADTQYVIKAGQLHADFDTLQGKARVDAFPGYMKALKDEREKIRNGLSNDDSRRKYDGPSMTFMSRSIFNGAGAAATANKQWQLNTAKSQMDLDAKTVEDDPKDDVLFQQKLNRTLGNAGTIAAIQGFEKGSPTEKSLYLQTSSGLWAQRIIGLSRTAPFEALEMLDKNKTKLTGADFMKVDNVVRAQGRAVGAVNIANVVYNAGTNVEEGKPVKTLAQMEKEATDKANELNPDDPLLAKHAVEALRGRYNQDKYARRQEEVANLQTVAAGIERGVRDERELRADPAVAAAIDALPKDKRLAIPGQINRYNAARDKVTNQDNYQRLYGLANNDVEAFLNTDITKEQLSQEDMRKLQEKQRKLKEVPTQDPRVWRAMDQIRVAMGPQLEALKIYKREVGNKEQYDKYTGAVQAALDVWQETNGKPATYRDVVDTIGPQIIQQVSEPGWLWGTNKVPFYAKTVPPEFSNKLKADIIAKGGAEPTQEQIQRAYTRTEFIKLYGKKKESP